METSALDPLLQLQNLFDHSIDLIAANQISPALENYDAVIKGFSKRRKIEFIEIVVRAHFNRAALLHKYGESDLALAGYEALIDKYIECDVIEIASRVIKAMMNKASILGAKGLSTESNAAYDAIVKRFGKRKEPEFSVHVDAVKQFRSAQKQVLKQRKARPN
jgi:tetratricopeptide (TPR) repeat protein